MPYGFTMIPFVKNPMPYFTAAPYVPYGVLNLEMQPSASLSALRFLQRGSTVTVDETQGALGLELECFTYLKFPAVVKPLTVSLPGLLLR